MMEMVWNTEFSEAMQARFPVITLDTAEAFTNLAAWRRNRKGGYYRWHQGKQYSVYRSGNRWRWFVRVVEDVPLIGPCGSTLAIPRDYFSKRSFATAQQAIENISREYLGM